MPGALRTLAMVTFSGVWYGSPDFAGKALGMTVAAVMVRSRVSLAEADVFGLLFTKRRFCSIGPHLPV